LGKLNAVHHNGQTHFAPLPAEALPAFMAHCERKMGEATFRTPRTTITAFIGLLAVLEQNPGSRWEGLLGGVELAFENDLSELGISDELVSLVL
jgi:hypothetical protein